MRDNADTAAVFDAERAEDAVREILLTAVVPRTAEVREALLAAYSAGFHDAQHDGAGADG